MKWTISKKLILCIGVITFFAIILIGYATFLMNRQASMASSLETDVLPLTAMADTLYDYTVESMQNLQQYLLTGEEDALEAFNTSIDSLSAQMQVKIDYVKNKPELQLASQTEIIQRNFNDFKRAATEDIRHTGNIYRIAREIKDLNSIINENADEIYIVILEILHEDVENNRVSSARGLSIIDHAGDLVDRANYLESALNDTLNNFSDVHLSEFNEYFALMQDSAEKLGSIISLPENIELFAAIEESFETLNRLVPDISTSITALAPVRQNTNKASASLMTGITNFNTLTSDMLSDRISQTSSALSRTAFISLIFMFFLLGLSILVFIYLRNGVIKQIDNFVVLTRELTSGDGDLTKAIRVKGKDELAALAEYFNHFVDSVRNIVGETKTAAENVASGNTELASTMEELSITFADQSQQINHLVSDIDVISQTSKENTQDLKLNHELISDAINESESGNKELHYVQERMRAINAQTETLSATINKLTGAIEHIRGILETINGIADQTNLLALNAAIEAARAGDAGKGFAVVADEVRALAERTQKATLEINDIIIQLSKESHKASSEMEHSASLVSEGMSSIDATNEVFTGITQKIGTAGGKVKTINHSIEKQYETITNVNNTVRFIASSIENSTKAVNEVVNTINHLQQRAERLMVLVSKFKTEK